MNEATKTAIALTVGAAAIVGLGGIVDENQLSVETDPALVLGWTAPVTDAAWAEDVKQENFDIKSDGVLNEMIASHEAKLARIQKDLDDWLACQECQYYPILKQNNGDKQAADAEFQSQMQQKVWDVEKLKQSVERMKKELELRQKGVVITDVSAGKKRTANELKSFAPNMIRKIND